MIIKLAKQWWSVFSKGQWTLIGLLWLVLFIPTFAFFYGRIQEREDKILREKIHEQVLQDRKEAKAEAVRRNAEKSSPDPSVRVASTNPSNRPTPETEQQPGEGLSVEVIEGVAMVTSGPLKGMTLEAAKAAETQRRLDTLAAAEKRREWELRRDALKKRYLENVDRVIASAEATIASADAELETMLSLYALMSPEQLENARQEALKTLPAEKVEAFFDALANHGTTKTPEQLTKDAQDILKSREAHEIARREIEVESQQIALEEEELKRTEPPIPW